MTQSTEKYTVFLTTQNLMNHFTGRQTHTHRDIMDDSDTELYKWWDNVDRKETFKDILKRVWKGGDFTSDEERIVEALHIISYLYNVVDSKGEDEQDIWAAINAVEKILDYSTAYQAWDNKRINREKSKKS